MKKRGFLVLFLNFAFVRVDYYVYSYCVSGEKWGTETSTSGVCQVTDLAVLDPATLSPLEIEYLIAQNISLDDDPTKVTNPNNMNVLMQIKIMLSMSAALNRIMKNPNTTFDTLTEALGQIKAIQDKMAGQLEKLPAFESLSDLLSKQLSDLDDNSESVRGVLHFVSSHASSYFLELCCFRYYSNLAFLSC
jgi:hypothetical protein